MSYIDNTIKTLPIIVSILALAISTYYTRKSFVASHRPYVWAVNYAFINGSNIYVPVPEKVAYRVKNSPAKIISVEIKILLNDQVLLSETEKDAVRFPDDRSEWTFSIGIEEFKKIMNRSDEEKNKILRLIRINYSSIDGEGNYHYTLNQSYNSIEKNWKMLKEDAN